MKLKTSLMATAATMALAASSQAQVVIDIVGSTAGRSTVDAQIKLLLSGESQVWYNVDTAKNSTSSSGADAALYKGGTMLISGVPTAVTVRTYWSGSAAGVRDVVTQPQLDNKFLDTSIVIGAGGGQVPNNTEIENPTGAQLADASAETVAEFGFSDVKQKATEYQSPTVIDQESMFVIPFRWLANNGATTPIANVSSQQGTTLFTKGGEARLSLFTGLSADQNTFVYAVGRDDDSGTRITAAAETGIGVFKPLTQYKPVLVGTDAGGGTFTHPYTITIDNIADYVENGGYASGGDIAQRIASTGPHCVAYVGISDAITALTTGGGRTPAKALTYDGVAFSGPAVINGQYTYWSYYQALRMNLAVNTPARVLYDQTKIALKALATPTTFATIKIGDMKCSRQADGATVIPN